MKNTFLTFSMIFLVFNTNAVTALKNLAPLVVKNDVVIFIDEQAITLRAGTPVVVESIQTYSSKNLNVGQSLTVRVKFNVVQNKQILVAAGALGSANISKLEKAGIFGKPGKMELQVQSVQSVDGQQVLLSGIPIVLEGKNRIALAWGIGIGVALVTLGLGLVLGFFIKGTDAEFNAGTNINSSVASDMEIDVN